MQEGSGDLTVPYKIHSAKSLYSIPATLYCIVNHMSNLLVA